ncbi:hypothetical protein NQ318_023303 [Aromia moschata]|uniref:Uncharacterized protein n=1 Tax=Aromia moschata TaxID=1265417 RepID=A0AAV8XS61_9CUCU|nr:hypothetical protein NQ318_023303 [Aromia moschata]
MHQCALKLKRVLDDDDSTHCAMLRYGEYSPNNPQLRVTAAPYLGLGEYEQRRNYFLQKQRDEYLKHIAKTNEHKKGTSKIILPANKQRSGLIEKSIQTDIQNIQSRLIQYELCSQNLPEKELSPHPVDESRFLVQKNPNLAPYRVDQRLTSAQNALLNQEMDKPKSILSNRRTGSPRSPRGKDYLLLYNILIFDRFLWLGTKTAVVRRSLHADLPGQLQLSVLQDGGAGKREAEAGRVPARAAHADRGEAQTAAAAEEQERREQDMANRRLEQQLLRMQEERFVEEQRRNRRDEQMRRHSEDLLRRKQDLQSRHGYRKHTDSESSVTSCLRNSTTDVASKQLSHYSPPVSRRIPYSLNIPSTSVFAEPTARYNPGRYDTYHRKETLRRMDSLNSIRPPSKYSTFSRFDSLSRIDSLNQRMESMSIRDSLSSGQRRHSATQQDLSLLKRSPRLHRRSSSSRFDDALPVPLLKAHSPVAKELKNSVPFNSARHSSDAVRKLEDRWQIPAVQKNIVNHADSSRDGQTRSILTQLGAIRMQLQQEQLRMDESLRRRGITQSKAVDFH